MESPSETRGRGLSSKASATRSKYAWRACQECRRRRAKCDGARPACSRCLGRDINCVYATEGDNRGTAPKSYVHLLQARINVLEQVLRLHSIDADESIAQLMAMNALPVTDASAAAGASSSTFDQLCTDFEGALCFDESSNFDRDGEARYFGTTSGRLEFQSPQTVESEDYSSLAENSQRLNLYSQALDAESDISEELMTHLIDLYFKWEQPWCQVVDESLFRQSKQTNGRYFSPLLLNCILAIASRYCDRPEVRSDPDDPNTAGRIFLDTAEVLLHFDLKWPSITTIQSLEIMAIHYVAIGSDAAGWLHHGMATRLALDMGLNLDSSVLAGSSRIHPQDVNLRRQIYWTLYCTDKLWASYTGRVCTMLDSQGMVSLPSVPDPVTDLDPQLSTTSFDSGSIMHLHRALTTHCQILEKILRNLYPLKRLPQRVQLQSLFDSYLLSLKSWFYELPTELKVKRSGELNTFPHAYVLNMVYHTSVILLAKPFLARRHKAGAEVAQQQDDSTCEGLSQKAAILCTEAAKEICVIGDMYRENFGSFRKSPLTATHCTLSAALVMLHGYNREDGKTTGPEMDCVDSCIKTLQELSDSWTPPRRYWRNLVRMIGNRQSSASDSVIATQEAQTDGHQDEARLTSATNILYNPEDTSQHLQQDAGLFTLGTELQQDELMLDFDMPFWSGLAPNLESLPEDYMNFDTQDFWN
ncbi:Zn(2)-Cys(6) zinc finger domain protein [Ilyonectria robusta]